MKIKFKKFLQKQWKEWRGIIFFVIFVVIPIRSSIADWSWVPTGSMKPTILEGELVFINKFAYDLNIPLTHKRIIHKSDPDRGDLVVLTSPDDGKKLVKRVIGIPGDTISMSNNILKINGQTLNYSNIDSKYLTYIPEEIKKKAIFKTENLLGIKHAVMSFVFLPSKRTFQEIVIPQGKYFIMGDNRDRSKDSRYFGFIDRDKIFGKALAVIFSFKIKDNLMPRFKRFFTSLT